MGPLSLKYLAAIVEALEQSQAHGKLSCYQSRHYCELYFRQGKLFYAFSSDEQQGDAVLYELLNWPETETRLEWQAGSNSRPSNVDEQEESAWVEALVHLEKRGFFFSSSHAPVIKAVADFLAIKTLETQPRQLNVKANSALVSPSARTLLPLGIISSSLSGPVPSGEFNNYLAKLRSASFSGYLRFQPGQTSATEIGQALLVAAQGELIYASLSLPSKAENVTGATALDYLMRFNLTALAVEVAPAIVEGWRGLLSGEKPYSQVTATQANYQNLLKSFWSGQRSGTIRIYRADLELYGLLARGQLLGIFKPESKSGSHVSYLQEQEELPEGLLERGDALMDVFLTGPARSIQFKPGSQISPADVDLLDRSFEAMIKLSAELAAPDRVANHLNRVIQKGSLEYPLLQNLVVSTEKDTALPRLDLKKIEPKLTATPKKEVLAAFDYLFEEFLQDYCRPIGPEIFHPMAARTLPPVDQERLLAMGLHLDFLTEEIPNSIPESIYRAEPADELINPYDF